MIHSTSLRAAGSGMEASIWVALLVGPLRRFSIAFFTSVVAGSRACDGGACSSGVSAPEPSGVEALTAPGRTGGSGAAAVPVLRDFDFSCSDLAVAPFVPDRFAVLLSLFPALASFPAFASFPVLASDFSVAAVECFAVALCAAVLAATPPASATTHANASAARYADPYPCFKVFPPKARAGRSYHRLG